MNHKLLSRLAAVLTQTIWGFSFIASKIAFSYTNPIILLAYRFTTAFLVMHLIRIAAGILSSVVAFYSQNYSVTYLPVAEATVFANLSTVVAIIAGVLILHEPLSRLTVPCTIVIIAGVIGVQLSARKDTVNVN